MKTFSLAYHRSPNRDPIIAQSMLCSTIRLL